MKVGRASGDRAPRAPRLRTWTGRAACVLIVATSTTATVGAQATAPDAEPLPLPGSEPAVAIPERYLRTAPGHVPARQRTPQKLYLTARDAHELVRARRNGVLFVDVRSRGEVTSLGRPASIHAAVPAMEFAPGQYWQPATHQISMTLNAGFTRSVERQATEMGLDHAGTIVLICSSGERSVLGASLLAEAGYTRVYIVVDGIEGGDAAWQPGWRHQGLPWAAPVAFDFPARRAD